MGRGSNETNGFTLVELSIVLVIIGLLIGGILAAQSMIETAKIQSFVRQIQQYDAVINSFQTQYNQLPGDSSLFPNPGNNDGSIYMVADPVNFYGGLGNADNDFAGEIGNVWYHLSVAGLLQTQYLSTIIAPNSCSGAGTPVPKVDTYFPSAKLGKNAGIWVGTDSTDQFAGQTIYSIASYSNFCVQSGNHNAFTPSEALAVDTKMDDGVANTGNVRATDVFDSGAPATTGASGCLVDNVNYAYNLNGPSSTPCSLGIKILSQTGQ